jgi:hypothetical protein
MYDLRSISQQRDQHQAEEIESLRHMTVQESIQLYASMQRAFEWQLQQSAPFFAAERRSALVELQARLNRLKG